MKRLLFVLAWTSWANVAFCHFACVDCPTTDNPPQPSAYADTDRTAVQHRRYNGDHDTRSGITGQAVSRV